jgi:cytochrome b561
LTFPFCGGFTIFEKLKETYFIIAFIISIHIIKKTGDSMTDKQTPITKHNHKTRLLHAIIAILVIIQLYSIYAVENKFYNDPIRTVLWNFHKYGGLVAFVALFSFWIVILTRSGGTSVTELFPWVSLRALKNLCYDIFHYIKSIMQFKIPEHTNPSPLASAIHGLGIIIMSVMAISGVNRYVVYEFSITKTPLIKYISGLHHTFADYAWIYLGIHVFVALINHIFKKQKLSSMWQFKK